MKHIFRSLWERVSAFLVKAGTIIAAMSIVIWALVTFPSPPAGATGPAIDYSIAGIIGHWIEPLFRPIGFTWAMCVALIPGLGAREVVIAALGTIYAVSVVGNETSTVHGLAYIVQTQWHLPVGLSFLVWYVYAPMCIATISVIKRETGSLKLTMKTVGFQALAAYVGAFITYQTTLLLVGS